MYSEIVDILGIVLKPCPFCGNAGYSQEEIVDGKTWHYVECGTCSSSTGRYGGYQTAKDRWNRRK